MRSDGASTVNNHSGPCPITVHNWGRVASHLLIAGGLDGVDPAVPVLQRLAVHVLHTEGKTMSHGYPEANAPSQCSLSSIRCAKRTGRNVLPCGDMDLCSCACDHGSDHWVDRRIFHTLAARPASDPRKNCHRNLRPATSLRVQPSPSWRQLSLLSWPVPEQPS